MLKRKALMESISSNLHNFLKKIETVARIQSIFDVFWLLVPIFQHGNVNLCWRLSRCLDRANM
jgi:hypothetical protein